MKSLPFFPLRLLFPFVFVMAVSAAGPEDFRFFDRFRTAVASVPGWVEKEDKYLTFTPKELPYIIGKSATEYEKQGLKKGVSILLMNGDRVLEIYLNDFGKFSRAKGMLYKRITTAPNAKPAPQFNVAPAYCDSVAGGCVAYWAKGDLYVEMTLSGYGSSGEAVYDAATLITKMSSAFSQ
jgi:hypothetical protein